ncbi:hypothetical protein LCGC14_1016740 [marine sediment metagenome]|uniref:Uncharacterized protein n=1 Tax=marine sediment metagenome TaxID=412755 RepID=A0A0F9N391_9ZZZZ
MTKENISSDRISKFLFTSGLKEDNKNINVHRIFKFIQNKQKIHEMVIIVNNRIRLKTED